MFIIVVAVVLIFIVFCIFINKYNKMIKYRNKVYESLSLIDIQLQSRFNLIHNLVKVVKEYSKHENEVFSKLIEVRKRAMEATNEKIKLEYANEMIPEMRQ